MLSTGGSDGAKSAATSAKTTSETSSKTTSSDSTSSTGPTRSTYKVKAGDSLSAIAESTGVDIETLQELNPDIDARTLQPGQKLKLKE